MLVNFLRWWDHFISYLGQWSNKYIRWSKFIKLYTENKCTLWYGTSLSIKLILKCFLRYCAKWGEKKCLGERRQIVIWNGNSKFNVKGANVLNCQYFFYLCLCGFFFLKQATSCMKMLDSCALREAESIDFMKKQLWDCQQVTESKWGNAQRDQTYLCMSLT